MKQQEKRLSPFVWFSVALACLAGVYFTAKNVRTGLDAKKWPEIKCRVTAFDETYTRKGKHHLRASFDYTYEGQRFTSTEFSVAGNSTRDTSVFQKYAAGSDAVCFVNPAKPSEAYLERKLGIWDWLMPPFALFLSILMAGSGIGEIRRRRRERAAKNTVFTVPTVQPAAADDETRRAA